MSHEPTGKEDSSLVAESRLMLRFVRESGRELPDDLRQDVGVLDARLVKGTQPSISGVPESFGITPDPVSEDPAVSDTELVLRVHGALSHLVAPATALTLRATEPEGESSGPLSRMPWIVKGAALTALGSAVLFVLSAGFGAVEQGRQPGAAASVSAAPTGSAPPVAPTAVPPKPAPPTSASAAESSAPPSATSSTPRPGSSAR